MKPVSNRRGGSGLPGAAVFLTALTERLSRDGSFWESFKSKEGKNPMLFKQMPICMVMALALTFLSSSHTTVLAQSINCNLGSDSLICQGDHEALNSFRFTCRSNAKDLGFRTGIVLAADLVDMGAGPLTGDSLCRLPTAPAEPSGGCPTPLDTSVSLLEEFDCIGIHLVCDPQLGYC